VYAKSKETTQIILDIARKLFIEKQYADVTVNDIVLNASLSKGALYHHFSSKEDVYIMMMLHYLGEIQASSEQVTQNVTGSCRERLHDSMLNFLELPEELLGVLRLVRRDINIFDAAIRSKIIEGYQAAIPLPVESIIRDGIAGGELKDIDPRLLSRQLVALVEVVLHPYSRNVLGGSQAMATYVINLFFDGVAAR
jgi:AcrR family transcriptional regulator